MFILPFSEQVTMAYFEVKADNVPLVPGINTFIATDEIESVFSGIEVTVKGETKTLQVMNCLFTHNYVQISANAEYIRRTFC